MERTKTPYERLMDAALRIADSDDDELEWRRARDNLLKSAVRYGRSRLSTGRYESIKP